MKKKIMLSLILAAGVLVIGAVALAHGPNYERGYGMGSGMSGYGMDRGMMGSGMSGYGMGRGMMGSGMSGYGMGRDMGSHMMGNHMGYGNGSGWNTGGPWGQPDEETANLMNGIYQKRIELRNLLNTSEVDIVKAKALQAEINKLENELSEKRLAAELKFRKDNPNWRPDTQYSQGRGNGSELCGNN